VTEVQRDSRTFRFEDQQDASRYALFDGDTLLAVIDYRDDGRSVSMTRAFTVPTFRGHGYAGVLTDLAVADLERRGDREVIPMCWYVAEWFDKNPGRAGILRAA
jgi:predicted GNAT family acetyltransferase